MVRWLKNIALAGSLLMLMASCAKSSDNSFYGLGDNSPTQKGGSGGVSSVALYDTTNPFCDYMLTDAYPKLGNNNIPAELSGTEPYLKLTLSHNGYCSGDEPYCSSLPSPTRIRYPFYINPPAIAMTIDSNQNLISVLVTVSADDVRDVIRALCLVGNTYIYRYGSLTGFIEHANGIVKIADYAFGNCAPDSKFNYGWRGGYYIKPGAPIICEPIKEVKVWMVLEALKKIGQADVIQSHAVHALGLSQNIKFPASASCSPYISTCSGDKRFIYNSGFKVMRPKNFRTIPGGLKTLLAP